MTPDTIIARPDSALQARVIRVSPLHYAAGPDATIDRPGHVRAGSGLAWAGGRLVVVQDDANFIALVDPDTARVQAIPLPAGAGGRRQFDDLLGNKAHKLDLEAVVAIARLGAEPMVLALGSGSTPRRECVATIDDVHAALAPHGPLVVVRSLPGFYARLRDTRAFAGSELNVEAAVLVQGSEDPVLRLFNRGNGAPRAGLVPVNATCDVSWNALAAHIADPEAAHPPLPSGIVRHELGSIDGVPLTFTDAALVPSDPAGGTRFMLYTAAAEASPDATRDGPVAGCCIGVIAEGAGGIISRWTMLREEAGNVFPGKVEGIAMRPDDSLRGWVIIDRDVPGLPSELGEILLEGPWFTPPATGWS